MIKPIYFSQNCFKADKTSVHPETGEYKDPMMKWPLRGAAFTNEVGEALRPLIGEYATLSWVPALMYIGADIYDKYKNDQTEYSPDSRRCLKQAIFQGMASIALPLVAVKAGQNIFSLLGLYSKDKVGINNKEHINKLAKNFVANGKMHAYHGKDDECVNDFLDIVKNNIESSKNMKNIENYAEKLIKNLIKLRKDLINPVEPFQSSVWYSNYTLALKKGQTQNVAVKSVLSKYLESGMLGGRFIKTLGGFLALGSAIAPIDHFVEHVLIGKVVAPKLDKKNTAE